MVEVTLVPFRSFKFSLFGDFASMEFVITEEVCSDSSIISLMTWPLGYFRATGLFWMTLWLTACFFILRWSKSLVIDFLRALPLGEMLYCCCFSPWISRNLKPRFTWSEDIVLLLGVLPTIFFPLARVGFLSNSSVEIRSSIFLDDGGINIWKVWALYSISYLWPLFCKNSL